VQDQRGARRVEHTAAPASGAREAGVVSSRLRIGTFTRSRIGDLGLPHDRTPRAKLLPQGADLLLSEQPLQRGRELRPWRS